MQTYIVSRSCCRWWCMIVALLPAAFLMGSDGANSQDAGQTKDWQQLTRDYAGAAVRVTEAQLAAANAMNKRVPGTIPADRIAEMTLLVESTRAREKSLKAGDPVDDSAAFVGTAELSLKQQQKAYSELQKVAVGAGLSAEKLNLVKARVQYAASRLALAKAAGSPQAMGD